MLPSLFSKERDQDPVAILALADGTVFKGVSIGASGHCVGQLVFNTAMTGHQEILSDPGCSGQLIAFTYPHIGSTGVNPEDNESAGIHAAGLIIRDCPSRVSNFRATQSLPDCLKAQGVVAISGIDTRKLTRILRDGGSQRACILVGEDAEHAVQLAQDDSLVQAGAPAIAPPPMPWTQGSWQLGEGYASAAGQRWHVVVQDFGVKYGTLRMLADRDCRLTVVPATASAQDILALRPDGVLLSSGPGNPASYEAAISACSQLVQERVPVFGINLGCQILALSLGAQVTQMETGHHGGNHPVKNLSTGRVYISSQNQAGQIDARSLPSTAVATYISLFDGSLQGFELSDAPAFGFQGHPEASPGPRDLAPLFDQFIRLMADQH